MTENLSMEANTWPPYNQRSTHLTATRSADDKWNPFDPSWKQVATYIERAEREFGLVRNSSASILGVKQHQSVQLDHR